MTPDTFLGLTPAGWTAIAALGTVVAAVGAVGTLIVAIVAARYAKDQLTSAQGQLESGRRQLELMQRTRQEEARPFVVVSLRYSGASKKFVNLVVENIGRTVAHDVRLIFEPRIRTTMDDTFALGDSPLIHDGIPTMPPGQRIQAVFDYGPDRKESDLPDRYTVTVKLKDAQRCEQESQRYELDLAQFRSLPYVNEFGVHHVAKALRDINERQARDGKQDERGTALGLP